jgi:hypothetical protein
LAVTVDSLAHHRREAGVGSCYLLFRPGKSSPPNFLVLSCSKFGYIGKEAVLANAPILLKLLPPAATERLPRRGGGILSKKTL